MWNLNRILRAFAGAAAITALVGCEETEPPPRVAQPIRIEAPKPPEAKVELPKKEEPKPEPQKVAEPKPEAKTEPTEPAVADESQTPAQILAGARDALSTGEMDRALKLAKMAVQKMPTRSAVYNTLGRVQLARGERKAAITSFEKAVELNPESSYAQNNLGLALIYDGKFAEAVDALEEATELSPVEPYMFNNLGMAYEHLDRLAEARDAYRQAAALKHPRAGENLARLEGVKSVRTAKLDTVKSDAVPASGAPTEVEIPTVMPDAGGADH
jgi:Flp pilus assembly protein TadD